MRAPHLNLHMPHWPRAGLHGPTLHLPSGAQAGWLALLFVFAVALLAALAAAISNPALLVGAYGEVPLAP